MSAFDAAQTARAWRRELEYVFGEKGWETLEPVLTALAERAYAAGMEDERRYQRVSKQANPFEDIQP